jgi:hypothetical protein
MPTQNKFFPPKFFCLLFTKGIFTSFFKDKKFKTVEIKVFLNFLLDGRIRVYIPTNNCGPLAGHIEF